MRLVLTGTSLNLQPGRLPGTILFLGRVEMSEKEMQAKVDLLVRRAEVAIDEANEKGWHTEEDVATRFGVNLSVAEEQLLEELEKEEFHQLLDEGLVDVKNQRGRSVEEMLTAFETKFGFES